MIADLILRATSAVLATSTLASIAQALPHPDATPIRVTPPVVEVGGLVEHRLSLNGTWHFMKDVPTDFNPAEPGLHTWAEVAVPGHFSSQGFGRMHREFDVPVAYWRPVAVPQGSGLTIALFFDSTRRRG